MAASRPGQPAELPEPPEGVEIRRRRMAQVADLYLRTRVLTAEPLRLVIEMHDAAITALERALVARAAGRETGSHVSRVIHVLGELDLFLDLRREPELAAAMAGVYEDLQTILAEECSDPSQATLEDALGYLRDLRAAWWAIRRQR